MRGRQIRPARVLQSVQEELKSTVMGSDKTYKPPWLNIVSSVPPSETLIRPIPTQHATAFGGSKKARKPHNIYRPQKIVYIEDKLRAAFYKDHPWELARPRIILESDGKDSQRCDWSKGVRQPGVALTGESVVQRQLYLMEAGQMTQNKAYDTARHEFYKLRQAEEIERRVALEEARHVGAYFGKTRGDVGMMLEDHEFENWKVWAGKETAARQAREASEVETFDPEDALSSTEAGPAGSAEARPSA
ncbi:37S ribosomal protein Rsm25 [Cordyceps militaris CM01]|uniref:37S ribosomal protein S25, mitochondrial n=2 Tax=Cordyceps militaris TaxID=73501 RepID=G3JTH1_CORMM|nr:37S ribosomal protein Rsm25 [Cordyceps militaris CM01]ATY62980.1 37S ribosomal Rsm25 [Cordyceps militaris]EGX87975.1 37S ribosomal protein Rsm25 [Cordyceps militaris CM01]